MSKTHSLTQGTMAAALVAAGATSIPSTNHMFYDLIDDLDARLQDGRLKERVLGSMAWMLDNACINAARSVFYKAYDNAVNLGVLEVNTIDAFNTMVVGLRELDHDGLHVLEIGFEDTSPMTQLKYMLLLRPDWHDTAARAAQCTGRDYQPKSFIELLAAEKLAPMDMQSHEKLRATVEAMSDGCTADEIEVLYKLSVKRQTEMAEARFTHRKAMDAATARILSLANASAKLMMPVNSFTKSQAAATEFTHDLAVSFHTLPDSVQMRFIDSAVKTLGRTLDEMATDRRVTTHEHLIAVREVKACTAALRDVLKSPRFTRALELN